MSKRVVLAILLSAAVVLAAGAPALAARSERVCILWYCVWVP